MDDYNLIRLVLSRQNKAFKVDLLQCRRKKCKKEEMSRDLTTNEVAKKCGVENQVVRRWCREGRFANAYQLPIKTGNGKVWLIPESDLKNFKPPGQGRPLSKNPSAEALKKRATRAKKKQNS